MTMNNPESKSTDRVYFILCFFSLFIFFVVFHAKNDNSGSDPRSCLLVTQSILDKFTIKLDSYGDELKKYGNSITIKNNHYYYFFPLGTSLCSIPFVAAANLAGLDMLKDEQKTQKFIAAILSVVIFILLFYIARLFVNISESMLFSLIFWFGSAYSSTMGTALWSHDFAAVFSLITLSACLRIYFNKESAKSFLIAFCLFFAYLCRPTLALLTPIVLLFVFMLDKKSSLKILFYFCLQMSFFSFFSFIELKQVLPDYYMPLRISGGFQINAFIGNLISPSRGIFVYSPFLLIPLLFLTKTWKTLIAHKKLALFLLWPLLHLISISKFPHWWGGWSYGSRLMSDILPAAYLICLLIYGNIDKKTFANIFLFLSGIFAIYINTYLGLYNPYTLIWHAEPNIDEHTEYLFDWKFPPFTYNLKKHEMRMWEYQLRKLSKTPLKPSKKYSFKDSGVLFSGFDYSGNKNRISAEQNSKILFFISDKNTFQGNLTFSAVSDKPVQVSASLNNTEIGIFDIAEKDHPASLPFPQSLLKKNKINSIGFNFLNNGTGENHPETDVQFFKIS